MPKCKYCGKSVNHMGSHVRHHCEAKKFVKAGGEITVPVTSEDPVVNVIQAEIEISKKRTSKLEALLAAIS